MASKTGLEAGPPLGGQFFQRTASPIAQTNGAANGCTSTRAGHTASVRAGRLAAEVARKAPL
jgi:hypothetical protein